MRGLFGWIHEGKITLFVNSHDCAAAARKHGGQCCGVDLRTSDPVSIRTEEEAKAFARQFADDDEDDAPRSPPSIARRS